MSSKTMKNAALAAAGALGFACAAMIATPSSSFAAPIPLDTAAVKAAVPPEVTKVYYHHRGYHRRGYYGGRRGYYGRGYYGRRGYYGGRGYYGRGGYGYYPGYGYPYYSYPYGAYSYPYAYPYPYSYGFGWGW